MIPLRDRPAPATAAPVTVLLCCFAVEGTAAALSRQAGALVVAAEISTLLMLAGPRLPLRVALGTLVAVGSLRAAQCLLRVRDERVSCAAAAASPSPQRCFDDSTLS